MGDGGAGGGAGVGESGAEGFVDALGAFDATQGGVSQALGDLQGATGVDVNTGMIGVPDLAYGSESPESNTGGGLTPNTPAPSSVVAESAKTPTAPKIERKRRRRSLLTQDEGGVSEDGAIERRSILGR